MTLCICHHLLSPSLQLFPTEATPVYVPHTVLGEQRPAHLLLEYCLLRIGAVREGGAWCLGGGGVEGGDGEYFLWKMIVLFSHMQERRPHLLSLSLALLSLSLALLAFPDLYIHKLISSSVGHTWEGKIPVWRPGASSLLLLLLLRFVLGGLFLSQQLRINCNEVLKHRVVHSPDLSKVLHFHRVGQ